MTVRTLVKAGEYRDSVALMLLARDLSALPGVTDLSVMMGTPANKSLLQQAGLLSAQAAAAGPNDLLIAVRAQNDAQAEAACRQVEEKLAQSARGGAADTSGVALPRSLRSAVRAAPQANVAVISVPGPYASGPAWDALHAGLHVLLFSDHVPLADEIALKQYGLAHGLLVMGPGAGTALINGVGLGFANAVPRGPVGIAAAAGTGLQEVSTLLAKAGVGITQGLGAGGRDVSEAVGGLTLLQGMEALQADPDTGVIVVISKLPSPAVTEKIFAQAQCSNKPTVLALMQDLRQPLPDSPAPHIHFAAELREAAALAASLARGQEAAAARARLAAEDRALWRKGRALRQRLHAGQRYLRGLYSGGTLCEEGMRIWEQALGPVWSNAPLDPRLKLPDSNRSKQHTAIDLGEEEFTVGRPHPMIDYGLRVQRLLREARDPRVAVIALDVVLGYGAHPDPAAELGPAIEQARGLAARRGRTLFVITSVTGTNGDRQGLARQKAALEKAGARVMPSNAAAARLVAAIVKAS